MRLTFASQIPSADGENKNIIPGIMIARVGIAKGHCVIKTQDGFEQFDPDRHPQNLALQVILSQTTLDSILSCAQESATGIKCLMNHSDDIVEVAGVFRDFRIDGDCIRADLHLLKSSRHKDYLLELAQECPEGFGVSINFYAGYSEKEHDAPNKTIACLCTKLSSCDLVTEPAATDGLFEVGPNKPQAPNTMPEENQTEESKPLSSEEIAKIAGDAAAAAVSESMSEVSEKLNQFTERLEKLETPPAEEEEESAEEAAAAEEEKMAKLAAKVAAEVITKLGVKAPVSPSVSNDGNDTTKMSFSEHVAHVRKTDGKDEITATKEVMSKFPDKHKAHLATLQK